MAIALPKKVSKRSEKTQAQKRISFWRGLLVTVVSILVVALIGASLWVSIGAITQKIKVSKEISQIIDLVDVTRRYANLDRTLGMTAHDDVLGRLSNAGQIQVSGNNGDGLKTLANPWGGTVVAYVVNTNLFRIETVVPSRACVRIISLLSPNLQSMGVKQIDAKGVDEAWRAIYVEKTQTAQNKLVNDQIVAGCRTKQFVILDFTFSLR